MIGTVHPRRLRLEPENDGLEDDFPKSSASRDVFSVSMFIFRGVIYFTRDDCFDGWTSLIPMTDHDYQQKARMILKNTPLLWT